MIYLRTFKPLKNLYGGDGGNKNPVPGSRRGRKDSKCMSRHLEKLANGEFEETIVNYDECKWLYDKVCCNDSSEWLADFPLDFCKTCRYFKKERR